MIKFNIVIYMILVNHKLNVQNVKTHINLLIINVYQ